MSREVDLEGLFEGLESKSFYDAPTLALSRLLEGNLAWDTWKKTWFDQSGLSPQERTAYTDRLKDALGGTSVGDALVDVATNPFVWFTFLTTPAGGTALKQGGRIFSSALSKSGGEFVGWAANNQSVMRHLGLLGLDSILMNTYMGPMLSWMGTKRATLMEEIGQGLIKPSRSYLEALGNKYGTKIDQLDPSRISNREARRQMESDLRVMAAWMEGFGKKVSRSSESPQHLVEVMLGKSKVRMTRNDARKLKSRLDEAAVSGENQAQSIRDLQNGVGLEDLDVWLEDGVQQSFGSMRKRWKDWKPGKSIEAPGDTVAVGFKKKTTDTDALFTGAGDDVLEEELKRRGLWDMAQAARKTREDWAVKLYGNERIWAEEGRFVADRDKVLRHFSQSTVDATNRPQFMEELLGGFHEFDDSRWFAGGTKGVAGEGGEQSFTEMFRKGGRQAKDAEKFVDRMVRNIQGRFDGVGRGGHVPLGTSTTDFVDELGRVVDDIDPVRSGLMGKGVDRVNRDVKVTWHMDDIEALRSDLSHLGLNQRRYDILVADNQAANIGVGQYRRVKRLDFSRGMHSFAHRSANQYMFNVMPLADDAFNIMEEALEHPIGKLGKGIRSKRSRLSLGIKSKRPDLKKPVVGDPFSSQADELADLERMTGDPTLSVDMDALAAASPGGYTVADMLDMGMQGLDKAGKGDIAEFLRAVALPRIRGEMPVRNMLTMQAIVQARKGARLLAKSPMGKALSESSDFGRRTIDWLENYGSRPVRFNDAAGLLHGSAGLLYSSHMGLNVPTLILNLTQPFLNAGSWIGYGNVLKSYKDAFEAMGRYSQWRLTTKALRLPIAERRMKIRELLDPDGLMQLSDDMLDTLDRPFTTAATTGKFRTALDVTLKGFEKTEWVNRLVTYHSLRRLFEGTHGAMNTWSGQVHRAFRSDAAHMLAQTQFTSTLMSTPLIFQGGHRYTGDFFANPLMRMFKTFPTRTLTSLASTSRILGQGRREIPGLGERDIGMLSGLYDLGRMVGAGALVYEVGKLGNMDLSRGLAPITQVDSAGLGDLAYGRDLPLVGTPPVLDIPFGMIKGFYEGDSDALRSSMYRMVPGGIGLRRLFEAMPSIPVVGGALQRRYADWNNIQPDGSVPVRDSTGRTVEAPNALETVMRGIGFDFTKLGGRSTLMDYMSKNKEAYQQAKYQALRAMRAGDMSKSLQIQNDFKSRTGIPLKVTQTDLDRFVKSADMTGPERFYKTLPVGVKDALFPTASPMLQGDPGTAAPPPMSFAG